eukprot:UN00416
MSAHPQKAHEKKPMAEWTNEEWCSFIKHHKIGKQKSRVFQKQKAKDIIKQIQSGGMTGQDFASKSPEQLKRELGLDDTTCNRFKIAKQTFKAKQQATQQSGTMPTTTNTLPDGEIKINIVLANGRSDTVTAFGDWTVGQLMAAIKGKCVVPQGFNILIGGQRYRDSDASKKLTETGLSVTNLTVRPVTGVKGG